MMMVYRYIKIECIEMSPSLHLAPLASCRAVSFLLEMINEGVKKLPKLCFLSQHALVTGPTR